MTRFDLIRHGQTDWNREGRYQGQADIPLNIAGLEQARKLASSLPVNGYTAIYTSDLIRARQTAQELANRLNIPIHIDARLREINQGSWQGRLLKDVEMELAHFFPNHWNDPVHARAPGGESVWEVAERMTQAVNEISHTHPGEHILLVGHGLALATIYCRACSIPLSEVYSHILDNTALISITWLPDQVDSNGSGDFSAAFE